jgi:PAS domain S-box-containing protein
MVNKSSGQKIEGIQRNKLYSILEASLNELYVFDPETLHFVYLNHSAISNIGYSMEQVRGMTPLDLKPEFTREGFTSLVMPLRTGERSKIVFETVHLRADGSTYPVEVHLQLVQVQESTDSFFLAVIQDISQRKQVEDELKRSYGRLELMQEVSQYRAENVQDLLDFALEKVIALTESSIGYIYYYSEERQQFTLNTWSKQVMAECAVVEPQSVYQLEKTGIWGEVVRQRRPILVNDYAAPSALKKGYPEGHVHLSRFLSVPVFEGDRIVAVVGVANKATPYDPSDQLQLTLMMEGVWKIATQLILREQLTTAAKDWQATFDGITDSVCLIDVNHRIKRCNASTCRILGRNFGEILNHPCWELFHDAETSLHNCPMDKVKQSLRSETSTIHYRDRWLEVTVDPILSSCGELTGGVHIVRDVTERIELINSVRETNELFSLFMKYSPIYCFIKKITDLGSLLLQASDNYVDMIGIPAVEMIGKTMHQLFPKEFADKITADDRLVVAGNQSIRLEEELNGRHYITFKFPIVQESGTHMLAGYTVDITDLKQAEMALKRSQSLLSATAAAARMGGWEVDLASDTHYWTDETFRIYEVASDFVPTMATALAFYAPESLPVITEAVERAIEFGEPFDLELYLITAKGKKRLVHAIGYAEFIEGKAVRLMGTIQDIHDQRLAEQELKKMQAQVIQQEKLATIGQLAAGVAHEINNPIGFVKSNLVSLEKYNRKIFDYLSRERLAIERYLPKTELAELAGFWRSAKLDFISEDIQDLVRESVEGTDRVRKIVQDLVSFSRNEGKELEPVNVNECLERSISIVWNEIKHLAELRTDFAEVVPVMANGQKLSQVFINLLINATHALDKHGVITVRTWQEESAVCIAIADTGCGIPLEIREKIFDLFFTTKEPGRGTGLGLAISNDLVHKMGGAIDVESEVGVGTVFTIRLPINQENARFVEEADHG